MVETVVLGMCRGSPVGALSLPEGYLILQQLHRVNRRLTKAPQMEGQERK